MNNYYFTYGSEGYPFKGGWTKVRADSRETAIKAFKIFHPARPNRILYCAAVYSEEEFMQTKMCRNGNFGEYTHECIDIYHSIIDKTEAGNDKVILSSLYGEVHNEK